MGNSEDSLEIADVESMLKFQEDALLKMKRNLINFKNEPVFSRKRIDRLKTRLETYKKEYDTFMYYHRSLTLQATKTEKEKPYFKDFVIDEFETAYCDAVTEVKEQIAAITRPTESVSESVQNQSFGIETNNDVRLPALPLPTFGGEYTEWSSFLDQFVAAVHKNHSLTNAKRLLYLKGVLNGEAAALLNGLTATDANFPIAWDMLKERYENKRIIFNHAMRLIVNVEPIKRETTLSFKSLIGIADAALKSLESVGIDKAAVSSMIAFLLTQKLPFETISYLEQSANDTILTYDELKKCVNIRIRSLDVLECQQNRNADTTINNVKSSSSKQFNTKKSVNQFHFSAKQNSHQGNSSSNSGFEVTCKACSEKHSIRNCSKFMSMPINERESLVERARLCRNCLSSQHFVAQCPSKRGCKECGVRHHTLIHPIQRQQTASSDSNGSSGTNNNLGATNSQSGTVLRANHTLNVHSFRQVLLATAIVFLQSITGDWIPMRALIDQGGDGCTITEAAAQLLKLPFTKQSIEIKPFGGGPSLMSFKLVGLKIRSIYNHLFQVEAPAAVLSSLTDALPANHIKVDKWPHIEGLKLADPEFFKSGKIDLVLGADVYSCIMMEGVRKGPLGSPLAQQTELGWILSGPVSNQNVITNSLRFNHAVIDFNESIQRFFQIESVPEVKPQSKTDAYCEEFFHRTVRRDENGRYILKLPFKNVHDQTAALGRSKTVALHQFLRLERRLNANDQFKSEYAKGMESYIEQNHMQLVTNTEQDCERTTSNGDSYDESYYIPHHAVIKESSTSTKLRNVFNASLKSSNGKSLNDILYPGPVMLADLLVVLLNWRCHRIAFMADITKMYRQIRIDESDITYQRIFWRSDSNQPISEYMLNRLTFGTNFAPSFAILAVHHLANLEKERFPNGARIIENDTYMDDTMSGNSTVELALRDQHEAITILKSAQMELCKWASNASELVEAVPETHREISVPLSLNGDESVKALGLYWNTTSDVFDFHVNIEETAKLYTKREIMSIICKLFDPLGLVSPVVANAKMFMREVWRSECDWDEPVNQQLQDKWRKYLSELTLLKQIKVNRWIGYLPNYVSLQLHGFCDASIHAYGAAIYLRVVYPSGDIKTFLVMSKSKVAPMAPPTIPRLELLGAVVLADLMKYVVKAFRHFKIESTDVKLWTDSQTVLQWLRSDPCRWQMFVSNRVMAIREKTEIEQWRHVRTHDNPADLISRGSTPAELQASKLWWSGPDWLQQLEDNWPVSDIIEGEPVEEKRTWHLNTFLHSQMEWRSTYLNRFSTSRNLFRATAWLHRLFATLSKRVEMKRASTGQTKSTVSIPQDTLTADELRNATLFWVKTVQHEAFSAEIESLTTKGQSCRVNRLNNLHPFVDSKGVLRVGGRLKNSNLSYNEKHPIIMPTKHHFTKLLITAAHLRTLHGGTQITMAYLRKTYWILNARKVIATTIHRCVACHRYRAKVSEQLMADLPAARVRISKPFTHVGVDFCGPFTTRSSKGRGIKTCKTWVAVFVCLCVRAIHLELVTDLSSEAFLAAFRRFISRRGLPKCMCSDCGTNFIGAAKDIKRKQSEYDAFITEHTVTALTNEGIEWNFNPPASPHFGGLFEAGVKSTKFHLKRILGPSNLTFEEFYTVLTQIEACLNSRPLVPQTNDPNDFTIITPGHFITGDSLLALPEPSLENETVAIGNRYRLIRKIRDDFWAQWSSEYLSRLQNRPKWQKVAENMKVNDMVLLCDERLPATKWPLARVIDTHPGADGLVRVVTIKTALGIYKRPVAKLSLLPFSNETENLI